MDLFSSSNPNIFVPSSNRAGVDGAFPWHAEKDGKSSQVEQSKVQCIMSVEPFPCWSIAHAARTLPAPVRRTTHLQSRLDVIEREIFEAERLQREFLSSRAGSVAVSWCNGAP